MHTTRAQCYFFDYFPTSNVEETPADFQRAIDAARSKNLHNDPQIRVEFVTVP